MHDGEARRFLVSPASIEELFSGSIIREMLRAVDRCRGVEHLFRFLLLAKKIEHDR